MPRRAVLAATLALFAAAPARAQTVDSLPQVADTLSTESWTFGASVGGGVGSFQLHCPTIAGLQVNCYDQRERGASAYARAGVFPRRHLFVGLEAVGWRSDIHGVDNRALFVSLVTQLYSPWTQGLYLRGGAGAALTWASDDVDEATTDGAAWSVGLGYDVPVTRELALTPSVTYLRSLEAEIELNGLPTQRAISHDLLQLGLGLTWR
jgi:hypothetical protein